jgi:hypothetical protein
LHGLSQVSFPERRSAPACRIARVTPLCSLQSRALIKAKRWFHPSWVGDAGGTTDTKQMDLLLE